MTEQKTFKRRVRARMEKTGESYTAARRMLLADGDRPDDAGLASPEFEPPAPEFEPPVSEERLVTATGRGWHEWLAIMDEWGATRRTHTEMARWLREEHGVDGWYSQSITVGFERARGMRAPGQRSDGFAAGATKTVPVPIERLFAAWDDERQREHWLPGAQLRVRTLTPLRSARYDWDDGSTRLIVSWEALGDEKSRVAISHERLPDRAASEEMKLWWRARLADLKAMLTG